MEEVRQEQPAWRSAALAKVPKPLNLLDVSLHLTFTCRVFDFGRNNDDDHSEMLPKLPCGSVNQVYNQVGAC
jgi:hypothetical protein